MADTAPRDIRGMAALSFKRSGNGWLFALPLTFPQRTYRVTDEQRTALAKPLRRMWQMQIVAIIVVVFVVMTVLPDRSPLMFGLAAVIATLAMLALCSIYSSIAIRPLLAGAPTTTERIGRLDIFKTQAAVFARWHIVVGALCSILLLAAGIFVGFNDGWDLIGTGSTVFFAVLSVYWFALLVAKSRQAQQP